MWHPICGFNLINYIQVIWVDIQLYNDQNLNITVNQKKNQNKKKTQKTKTPHASRLTIILQMFTSSIPSLMAYEKTQKVCKKSTLEQFIK